MQTLNGCAFYRNSFHLNKLCISYNVHFSNRFFQIPKTKSVYFYAYHFVAVFCIISPQSVKHMENTFTHMCAATIIKRFPWAYIRFNLFLTPKRVCDAYVPFADCPMQFARDYKIGRKQDP